MQSLKGFHEEKLRAITVIAQCHVLRGETIQTNSYVNMGKELFTKSKSAAYNSLYLVVSSLFLNDQTCFKDSLELLNKTDTYKNLRTDYPPVYHFVLYQKVETLIKLGRLKEAKETLDHFEDVVMKFFQKRTHANLANIYIFKNLISLAQHKLNDKAFDSFKEALKIYETLYHGKENHRNQARAHLTLGKAYIFKKDYTKALESYLLSEKIYNALLKGNKIDDVSDLYKELALLGISLKDDGLTHHYLKAHIDTFGQAHPRTQEILHMLDKNGLVAPL